MIETVLFDLAEVCMHGMIGIEKEIANAADFTEEEVYPHLRGEKIYDLFRGKITEDEYWRKVIEQGNYKMPLKFFKKTIRNNFQETPGIRRIIEALKRRDYQLGLLSDHAREWIEYIEPRFSIINFFPTRCYSFESRYIKKIDPESFQYALQRLNANPKSTLFIDDNPNNIKMAQRVGIHYAHRFINTKILENIMLEFGIEL